MKIILTEQQLHNILSHNNEDKIYFNTFSEAVQIAKQSAEARGYEIDEEDWWHQVSVGQGRPKDGETTRMSIGLWKNGKLQKKALHIQVYNRGLKFKNNYELNFYIF
jgi:hypothetical protein